MSEMIRCDKCKKMMFTDSRSPKGVYASVTIYDPLLGTSFVHLCRNCLNELLLKMGWDKEELFEVEEETEE